MRGMCRDVAIGLAFVSSLGFPANCRAVDFAPANIYPVGASPKMAVVGDFNGDGNMDIAVVNSGSGNVSILLGNGDGTFQAAINFDIGMAQPSSLVVGDFNNDRKLDLAVSSSSSSIFLGNGDGTFGTAIPISNGAGRLFTVDVNLDGKLDLVVGGSLFLGNGDGTFQAARDLGALPEFAGDLNGDHKPDFAAVGANGVFILFGNGDGTFQTLVLQAPANTTYSGGLFAGDYNDDGIIDLVVQGHRLATPGCTDFCIHVSVLDKYLGIGRGQFSAAGSLAFTGSGALVADFNGDGKFDLLFPSGNPGYCPCPNGMLLLGPVFNHEPLQLPGNLAQGAAADFNGDGLPDLVFVDNSNAVVVVFLNTSPTLGADMGIIATVTMPQPAVVGLNFTYTVNFLNEGPKDATGVTFTDSLPSVVSFVSAASGQGGCIQSQGVISCNIGALASGSAADVTIIVTPMVAGTITNTMSVSAIEADLVPANNSATQSNTVLPVFALTLAKAGAGTGTVTSSPGGIDCGGACSQSFTSGTSVMLAAIPSANSIFGGWSGACTGTDPNVCNVILNSTQSVTVTFSLAPDFSLSAAATSLNVKRGGQASETLTFVGQGGFSGTIALTCSMSGLPPMPACGISPNSVSPGSDATLTVNAASLSAARTPQLFNSATGLRATLLPIGIVGFILVLFDRKRRRTWTLCLLLIVTTLLPVSCGGGSSNPPPPAAQNYAVTVTATSGMLQHSTIISVTVN